MQKLLNQLQLSPREALIYETLLKLGSASAAQVARELSLPRQTVYSILLNFAEQQLVDVSDKGGVKQFAANQGILLRYIERRKDGLEKTRKEVEEELPKFLKKFRQKEPPKVTYYEGQNGLKHLFEGILEVYEAGIAKDFRGYGVNYIRPAVSNDFLFDFIKKRHSHGVITKLLVGRGETDFGITKPENTYGRTVKHIDMDPQKAAVYLVDDRIYIFSYEDEVGIMVENKSVAQLLKAVFDAQWEQTKYKIT